MEQLQLSVRGVNYAYNKEKPVLRGIDAEFSSGRLTGLLGPNGSGKTTLLRLLTGGIKPDQGEILLNGASIATLRPRELARKMALVPQRAEIAFDYTALDVVLMGRQPFLSRFQRESEADIELARQAMRRFDVLPLSERRASELSGGEWQRVCLARAICQGAGVLLLDEPVSSLDIRHQIDTLRLLNRLAREEGVCCVCVLHDLNLAAHFCDELYVLHAGSVYAAGSPEKILTASLAEKVYGIEARVARDAAGRIRLDPTYREI